MRVKNSCYSTRAMETVISPVDTAARKNLGIKAGDIVRVHQKIQEKGKTRLQVFEGMVLYRKHGNEAGGTFTVRRTASGVGVEKTFPLYSPMIEKIEIVKRAKVRRAKLYYIREKVAREIRRTLRGARVMGTSTDDLVAPEKETEAGDEAVPAAEESSTSPAAEDAPAPQGKEEEKNTAEPQSDPEPQKESARAADAEPQEKQEEKAA